MQTIDLTKIQAAVDSKNSQQLAECAKPPSDNSESLMRKRAMIRLWQVLSELYGHKFISQYGDEPSQVWARALENVGLANIKRGIERLPERKDEWPPTAIEFFNLCREVTISPDGTNSAAYIENQVEKPLMLTDELAYERAQRGRDKLFNQDWAEDLTQ